MKDDERSNYPKNEGNSTSSSPHKQDDDEYNCTECDFQGTSDSQLKKHVYHKHTPKSQHPGNIECRICGEFFETKWTLMNHRKDKHISFVRTCNKYLENRCIFTSSKCWWIHEEQQNPPQ